MRNDDDVSEQYAKNRILTRRKIFAGAAGINDNLVRVAVGLEKVEDLKTDLARGMRAGS
jgi:cystathionine beta-lyase/cystathionine gamma-synthase